MANLFWSMGFSEKDEAKFMALRQVYGYKNGITTISGIMRLLVTEKFEALKNHPDINLVSKEVIDRIAMSR